MKNSNFESTMDQESDKFKDECGVFGVYSNKTVDVAGMTYYGLYSLQHRGQESAGIAVADGKKINMYKGLGLVTEAFKSKNVCELKGNIGIGHVRYSTAGGKGIENAQPIVSTSKFNSIAIAHNGNLVNDHLIKGLLEEHGEAFYTTSDSEVISCLIVKGIKKGIVKAISDAMSIIKGSFALTIMSKDKLIGVRDPHGIRPLCIGKFDEGYVLASESCALDTVGAEFLRDVKPGEIVVIDENGIHSYKYSQNPKCEICAFEYIYFARPDSKIDNLDVYKTRVNTGKELYKEHHLKADLVIAVPDSGIPAAIGYSIASGIPYDTGFVKNRYVGRTFITPSQEMRERLVGLKLNPIKANLQGKSIILIDDSIVRGTTSKQLVSSLKRAGVKEVKFLIASPSVKYPCYLGIDTPCKEELIASNNKIENIKEMIGADYLGYLSEQGFYNSCNGRKSFCMGCFNGTYPVEICIEEQFV